MPFLPPNQQHQSTEGKINLPVNANKMIYKHHCIFNNLKSLKATKKQIHQISFRKTKESDKPKSLVEVNIQ